MEAEQNAFTVSVWVSEVGAVEYVVYYSDFNVSYHRTPLLQALEEPVCSSHMEVADADELRGAVAASGSFPVPRADEAFLVRLDPPCPQPSPEQTHPGPLPCSVASQGLSPSSLYRLCLLAIDASGNR